jgi:hypothetical protein
MSESFLDTHVRLPHFQTDSAKRLRTTHTIQSEGFNCTIPEDEISAIKPFLSRLNYQFNRVKSV